MDRIELSGLEALNQAMALPERENKHLLSRLNAEQKEAVCQDWGPSLIVAGAGSGKTTVLTRRIAYLISELRQSVDSIMAVTFTNKAAREMKSRVETIVGTHKLRFAWIGTFHSMCARLLRREIEGYTSEEGFKWSKNFVIYDETDSLNVMKAQIKELGFDEKMYVPREIRHIISSAKNDGYTYSLFASENTDYRESKIAEIFHAYQKELARNNAFDFDDLILVFTDVLRRQPHVREHLMHHFKHLLIDEFQDTNKAQYEFVRLLFDVTTDSNEIVAGRPLMAAENARARKIDERELADKWNGRSLMVVGDVDQSIYSWRKADYRIFLGFQNNFPNARVIKLEENYRSTSTILDIANSIIQNNTERIEKVLRCNRKKGSKAQYYEGSDQIDEAYYVVGQLKQLKARGRSYSDATILYRTNAQSRAIEEVLIRSGIQYTVIGGTKFYDRQEIKDLIAYLKLVYNPKDGQAFNRVINTPKRGIGKTSLERLEAYASQRGLSPAEAALEVQRIPNIPLKAAQALYQFANTLFSRWRSEVESTTSKSDSDSEISGDEIAPQDIGNITMIEDSSIEDTSDDSGDEDTSGPVSGLLGLILHDTKYMEMLEQEAAAEKDELSYGRIENVRELLAVANEFEQVADEPDLESFLTRIALISDIDEDQNKSDAVRLMTLHSAKGLEFPVVFIMGLEEGLFPHMRSFDSPSGLEEERRLMYVGVTRAEDMLYITRARKRFMGRGSGATVMSTIPSMFLEEITPGLLTGYYPCKSNQESITRHRFEDDEYDDSDSQDFDEPAYGKRRTAPHGRSYEERANANEASRRASTLPDYGGRSDTNGGSRVGSFGSSRSNSQNGYRSDRSNESTANRPGHISSTNSRQEQPGNVTPLHRGTSADRSSNQSRSSDQSSHNVSPQEETFERLSVGDTIQHSSFGIGKVVEVLNPGAKELYKIDFGKDKRLFDPRFAKLIKLN